MSNYITCIYQLSFPESNLNDFKKLVLNIVKEAQKETGTIEYSYSFNSTGNSGQIIEKYRSSEDIISHVDDTFSPFGDAFLSLVNITSLTVVGDINDDAKSRLNVFDPIYLMSFAGFSK